MLIKERFENVISNSDELPYDIIQNIKKIIKQFAFDGSVIVRHPLQLVHVAYKENNVERPLFSFKKAWSQYEDILTFAVKMLNQATTKGIRDDSWKTI